MLRKFFGDRIKFLRTLEGLIQEQLAEAVEVTKQHLGRIERGLAAPSFDVIYRLCLALKRPPANLFLFSKAQIQQDSIQEFKKIHESIFFVDPPVMPMISTCGAWFVNTQNENETYTHSLAQILGVKISNKVLDAFDKVMDESQFQLVKNLYKNIYTGYANEPLKCVVQTDDNLSKVVCLYPIMLSVDKDIAYNSCILVVDVSDMYHFLYQLLCNEQYIYNILNDKNRHLQKSLENEYNEYCLRNTAEKDLLIYKIMVEFSSLPMAFVEKTKRYGFINSAYKKLFHFHESISENGPFHGDVVNGNSDFSFDDLVEEALEGQDVSRKGWIDIQTEGRSKRFLHITCNPHVAQNEVQGVVVTIHDMTGEKEEKIQLQNVMEKLHTSYQRLQVAQKVLTKSENRYRTLFDNALEGLFLTTSNGRFLNANPALAAMLGYSSAHDLIATVTDIATQIYARPEDRRTLDRLLLDQGKVQDLEVQLRRRDGSLMWGWLHIRRISDISGEPDQYQGFVIDITRRKQAEECLRSGESSIDPQSTNE